MINPNNNASASSSSGAASAGCFSSMQDRDRMDINKLYTESRRFITGSLHGPSDISGVNNILVRSMAVVSIYQSATKAKILSQMSQNGLFEITDETIAKAFDHAVQMFLDTNEREDRKDVSRDRERYSDMHRRRGRRTHSLSRGGPTWDTAGNWINQEEVVVDRLVGLKEIAGEYHAAVTDCIFEMFSMLADPQFVKTPSYTAMSGLLSEAIQGLTAVLGWLEEDPRAFTTAKWKTFNLLCRVDRVGQPPSCSGTYESYNYLICL